MEEWQRCFLSGVGILVIYPFTRAGEAGALRVMEEWQCCVLIGVGILIIYASR